MNPSDDPNRQPGASGTQQGMQQPGSQSQQGGQPQQGSQAQQFSQTRGQQGDISGQQPGQQGTGQQGTSGAPAARQGTAMSGRAGSAVPDSMRRRNNPFEMLRRLDDDMDRLFHQLWGGGRNLMMRGFGGADMPSMWMPQTEIFERDGKLHVHADLPGLNKEDVKLSIEGDNLILQGERRASHEDTGQGGVYHSERSYGGFYRSIPLPEGVDPQTVDASFKDGVLDVCFDAPKSLQARSRQVQIR